ncbi:MAG: hypothetical protein DDT40_01025 [candidate division WS2 bacterium]|nr:hypothetical protein [Candidatus Psychracetigena formicireducens]
MLAVPLSLALLLLCGVFKNKLAKAALLLVPVSLLSFLMIMSPVANLDNRTFSPNTVVRYAFTKSELQALNTISNISDRQMGSDYLYNLLSFELQGINIKGIDYYLYHGDFSQLQHLIIIIREKIVKHPFHTPFAGIVRLNHDPRLALDRQGLSRIYDNGGVSGFLKLQ